jgi:rubrerythrin
MTKKLTTEEFIEKAKNVHGDKYDYSLVEYVNNKTNVKIICRKHGTFEQRADLHKNGKGCPKCAGKNKTTEDFIKESKEIHGDRFDYSLTEYINSLTKVKIKCKLCDDIFEQTTSNHLSGNGCPICVGRKKAYKKNKIQQKKYFDDFIKKATIIHSDKFDYSLTEYINSSVKIKIKCKLCDNVFEQTPNNHISKKYGCPSCGKTKATKTTENFITDAKKIHGNYYDYSQVKYINNNTKVEIICDKHGIFKQLPITHIQGEKGCPICKNSKGEMKIRNLLLKNKIIFEQEKRFIDCRDKLPLPFDFYLETLNIIIEFDGKQHFEAFGKWGGEKKIKETQYHDKIKNEYCINNNIHLIRIRYDESIKDKLKDIL